MPFLFLFYSKAPIDPTCSPSSCFLPVFQVVVSQGLMKPRDRNMFPATRRRCLEIPDQACAGDTDSPREKAPQTVGIIVFPQLRNIQVTWLGSFPSGQLSWPVKQERKRNFVTSTIYTSFQQEHPLAGAALEHLSLILTQISSLGLKIKESREGWPEHWWFTRGKFTEKYRQAQRNTREYPEMTRWSEVVTEGPLGERGRKGQRAEYSPCRTRDKSCLKGGAWEVWFATYLEIKKGGNGWDQGQRPF